MSSGAELSLIVPALGGWTRRDRQAGRVVLDHPSGAVATVSAQSVADPCDPRAVAARLAARLGERDPSATVALRRWGTFGERPAAVQVVELGSITQLHGVSGGAGAEDPLIVVVVVAPAGQGDEAGHALAALVAGTRAGVVAP